MNFAEKTTDLDVEKAVGRFLHNAPDRCGGGVQKKVKNPGKCFPRKLKLVVCLFRTNEASGMRTV